MEILLFIFVSISIIAIPGPNVLIIISTSITHGKTRGLQTVAGTSVAMIIQLMVAALGTSYFIAALAKGFVWLKWAGVAYLIYLGSTHLLKAFRSDEERPKSSAIGSFQRGFWVSLTNPKTILFFGAFLPQFTVQESAFLPQIATLSIMFWLLAVFLDSMYALAASKLTSLFKQKRLYRYQNGVCGTLYCGAGTLLAATKNS